MRHCIPLFGLAVFTSLLALSQAQIHVLATRSHHLIQWTCFNVASSTTTSQECCEEIYQSAPALLPNKAPSLQDCTSQIAPVPSVLESIRFESNHTSRFFATFSWSVLEEKDSNEESPSQFVWNGTQWQPTPVTNPYWLPASLPADAPVMEKGITIESQLSPTGGMHRLFHHDIQIDPSLLATIHSFLLFITIPRGMFIDLDDAAEVPGLTWKIHAARRCDIELPSFESEQHVVVLEVTPTVTSFFSMATKLHLRYAEPTGEEWIRDLPKPTVLVVVEEEEEEGTGAHRRIISSQVSGMIDPVWVAAGHAEDYPWVVGITLCASWIGMLWMMSDLDYVARWDKVVD